MSIDGKPENTTFKIGDEVIANLIPLGKKKGIVTSVSTRTIKIDIFTEGSNGSLIKDVSILPEYLKHITISYMKKVKEGVKPKK